MNEYVSQQLDFKYSLAFMDIEGMSDTIYFDSLPQLSYYLANSEPSNFILTATINLIKV